jgi:hypothetical protein
LIAKVLATPEALKLAGGGDAAPAAPAPAAEPTPAPAPAPVAEDAAKPVDDDLVSFAFLFIEKKSD